jgi:hypothetical protein
MPEEIINAVNVLEVKAPEPTPTTGSDV